MAYSTNSDLANASDELQIVQCVDDAKTNLTTIADVEAAAADSQHEHYQAAGKMIDRIDEARSNADELINTFLRGRFDVPLDPVPAFIADISNDLTKHNIYKRRLGSDMSKEQKELKDDSVSMLLKVQQGKLEISESPKVGAGHFKTNKKASDKVWGKDTLDRY